MAKQKKRPLQGKDKRQGGRQAVVVLLVLVVLGIAGGFLLFRYGSGVSKEAQVTAGRGLVRRETKPLLSPALFVGKAARAHAIAQEIPDVLDQFYCYCGCDKHTGHKSLLSCYTDGHAAT